MVEPVFSSLMALILLGGCLGIQLKLVKQHGHVLRSLPFPAAHTSSPKHVVCPKVDTQYLQQ